MTMGGIRIFHMIGKTLRYAKRNGLINTFFSAAERAARLRRRYRYEPPSQRELSAQRTHIWTNAPKISVLVPAYETKEEYLRALLESVKGQTYFNWELIVADAGESGTVRELVQSYGALDARICYHQLKENLGISGNSNAGLAYVSGAYTALLDHDDLLTPDALYEMAAAAVENPDAVLLYSDEDKCDASGRKFHTPHRKTDFDPDLFLSNNYICHLAMLRTQTLRELRFRPEYDGAQDYDLFLRVFLAGRRIVHVPRVLYHWRCHKSSTAADPASKGYAYEAGRRALDDFFRAAGWRAHAEEDAHRGFYRTVYDGDIFEIRREVGAVGGRLLRFGRIVGGAMEADGTVRYRGLPARFSGEMNRAALAQQAFALDLRNMRVREELAGLHREYLGRMKEGEEPSVSLEFCREVRARGYRLVYLPWSSRRA